MQTKQPKIKNKAHKLHKYFCLQNNSNN